MAKLKVGSKAPAFKLKDKSGTEYGLKDLDADYKVIYFYPKDDTPGCTLEAKAFTKTRNKFSKLNTAVVGISGGDEKSKTSFCKKHRLKVLLLSDVDFKTAKKYGAYGKKSFMGRTYNGILRKTFILNEKDRVIKIYDKVTPEEHPEEIVEFLSSFED